MLPWITLGLCTTAFLGAVPVSALVHQHRVLGSEDFGQPMGARSGARDNGNPNATSLDSFDYIIVGGGTGGNAVAARLSQGLPSASILIIEAGSYVTDNLDINVPGLRGKTLSTIYDWNFTTVPIEVLNNRTIPVNRGKVMGGCSAHNGLIWNRGAAAEYDSWEDLGNPGWNWETIYAGMAKSENYNDGPSGLGTSGPIHTLINRVLSPMLNLWESSIGNISALSGNTDPNQGSPVGVSLGGPFSIDPTNYNSSYSTNGYLPQAGPNLSILPDSTVAKVNLQRAGSNGTLQRATGVTLLDGTVITANREVILSAGTIQSPQLLELSGIGQPDILRAANIDPIINLPGVGENYQDHVGISISYQIRDDLDYATADLLDTNATYAANELAKWLHNQTSQYDAVGGVGFAFADWTTMLSAEESARLQAVAASPSANTSEYSDAVTRKKIALLNDTSVPQIELVLATGYSGGKGYPAEGTALYGKRFFSLEGAVEHPLSRGSTHINASDPVHGAPVIDPRYSEHPYDRAALLATARVLRAIAAAEPLRSIWVDEYEPGFAVVPEDPTDEEWWDGFVAGAATTSWHITSTCSLLPLEDGGVVGPDLRVYGTDNLRVVDASVIPLQISAHSQTIVYGIAEVAAGLIIADA